MCVVTQWRMGGYKFERPIRPSMVTCLYISLPLVRTTVQSTIEVLQRRYTHEWSNRRVSPPSHVSPGLGRLLEALVSLPNGHLRQSYVSRSADNCAVPAILH